MRFKVRNAFRFPVIGATPMVVLSVLGFGCAEPASRQHAEEPAVVENARAEDDLTTLRLSQLAIERLGIETEPLSMREISRGQTFGGDLIVPPGRAVTVTAPISGTVLAATTKRARPGEWLTSSQEVFRLRPMSPADDIVNLEIEAAARLEVAQLQAKRAEQLLADRAGSVKDLERARADLAIAEAAHRSARAQLEKFAPSEEGERQAGAEWTLASPLAGRLTQQFVAVDQSVVVGAPLFEVVSENPLWLRVPVYAGDLSTIEPQSAARVRGLGETNEAGWVSARPIDAPSSANPAAVTVDLFYALDNGQARFRPGEKVRVQLDLRGEASSRAIPSSAIVYDIHGGAWIYENPEEGVYVRRRVEVLFQADGIAAIGKGPELGISVVTSGVAELFGSEFGVGH